MTLAEAAAVFFPDGPLTLASLRTAIRDGDLAVARVAGKILTTPRAIREMTLPERGSNRRPRVAGGANDPVAAQSKSMSPEAAEAAQLALTATIADIRASLRASKDPTPPKSKRRPSR